MSGHAGSHQQGFILGTLLELLQHLEMDVDLMEAILMVVRERVFPDNRKFKIQNGIFRLDTWSLLWRWSQGYGVWRICGG